MLPQDLWFRVWELLQTDAAAPVHRSLWMLAIDWIRAETPCSIFALDLHWRSQPQLRDVLLQFMARLLEERHPATEAWTWCQLDQFLGETLNQSLSPDLLVSALCVLGNWACGHRERGEVLRTLPVWARIWQWFGCDGFDSSLGASAFQVLCNAAGPSLALSLETQWEALLRQIWDRVAHLPVLTVRRGIHLGARLLQSRDDVFWVAKHGILARMVHQFGRDPVLREDVQTCMETWRAITLNPEGGRASDSEFNSDALWSWISASCGWTSIMTSDPSGESSPGVMSGVNSPTRPH
jgi:hypothetical protein